MEIQEDYHHIEEQKKKSWKSTILRNENCKIQILSKISINFDTETTENLKETEIQNDFLYLHLNELDQIILF